MKKIVLLTASYPIHPRLLKIGETLKEKYNTNMLTVHSFNFANKKVSLKKENELVYSYKYNNKLYKYFIAYFNLKKNIKNDDTNIFVCRGILTLVLLLCLNVKKNIYYDIPDLLENKKFLMNLEKILLNRCSRVILASRFFYVFYKKYAEKILILENYPSKEMYKPDLKIKFNFEKKGKKIISFIGFIRYFEVLKNLVDIVKTKDIDLLFFGSGVDEEKLKLYCQKNDIKNVYFFGEYNFRDLNLFYNLSDYIWASYDYRITNVKYAISNKFYESILYEKIGIYSKNTLLGDYVLKKGIGLVVDCFNKKEMDIFFDSLISSDYSLINKNIIQYKKENILFWEQQLEIVKHKI